MKNSATPTPSVGSVTPVNVPDDPWDHWWKRSPFFRLDAFKNYNCRPDAEFWHEHFWEPRRLSAWAYELVRRLAKMRKLKTLPLSDGDRELVQSMPPYPRLTARQKLILHAVFWNEYRDDWALHEDKGDPALLKQRPWKQGQANKLGDWRQVELLDAHYNPADKDQRGAVKKYIGRYFPLLRGSWSFIQREDTKVAFLHPELPEHELSGYSFTREQFEKVLREALGPAKRMVGPRNK